MLSMMRKISSLALAAGLSLAATAQTFPSSPITFVVPYAAGSVNDIAARVVGAKMSEILGQPINIDNRPGANTIVGAQAVAKAQPNGYTLLFTTAATNVQNPLLYKKLPYTPEDFVPISQLSVNGNMSLVINPSIPARTLKEFVEYARQKGGKLSYASIGNGSTHNVYMELLKQKAGIEMEHVPYKATPTAEMDLVRGDVAIMFTGQGTSAPLEKAGKVRILAVSGTRRIPLIPHVPTMTEAGFEGFEATSWVSLYAPAQTPQAIVDTLSAAAVRAAKSDEVRAGFDKIGLFPYGSSNKEFIADLKRDTALWRKVFSDSKVPLLTE